MEISTLKVSENDIFGNMEKKLSIVLIWKKMYIV